MKLIVRLFGIASVLLSSLSWAQTDVQDDTSSTEADSIYIKRALICVGVKDREPVEPDSVFGASVGRLYFFTEVMSTKKMTYVEHVWYYKDEEVFRIRLYVRSQRWRTWSSKAIPRRWIGEWRTEVLSEDEKALKELAFKIDELE